MAVYNLIEYSDNYSYTSRSLQQFKRDESPVTNTGNPNDVSIYNLASFKYKSSFIRKSANIGGNRVYRGVKIAVPIKYLGNLWRLLEIPLINCKFHLELNWSINCVMSDVAGVTEFKIIKTKLYVPIVTLSKTDNVKLVKLLENGFKRPVYWNEQETKIKTKNLDGNNFTRFFLDAFFEGVRRLLVLAFNNTHNDAKKVERNSHRKYFLPR